MGLSRDPENVGENHDISFEAPFTLSLASHIDMLFSCVLFVISYFCLLFGWILFLAESLSSLWKYFFFVRIHGSVYIINSLLAANSMCSWEPYLFDCQLRLIKVFHFMRLTIRAAYIFYIFALSKGIDHAQCFLGYVLSTNSSFAFNFLQHHLHIRHKRNYDKQKAVVVA